MRRPVVATGAQNPAVERISREMTWNLMRLQPLLRASVGTGGLLYQQQYQRAGGRDKELHEMVAVVKVSIGTGGWA